jgi:hypothetical protein
MKLFMKYLFWGPQNIFSLEKPTSKIYFQALHHLEDSESVKVVKRFFSKNVHDINCKVLKNHSKTNLRQ